MPVAMMAAAAQAAPQRLACAAHAAGSTELRPAVPAPHACSESRERHQQERIDQGLDADEGNQNAWVGSEAEATELMVYHASILRNKRLLFAYMCARLAQGAVLHSRASPPCPPPESRVLMARTAAEPVPAGALPSYAPPPS